MKTLFTKTELDVKYALLVIFTSFELLSTSLWIPAWPEVVAAGLTIAVPSIVWLLFSFFLAYDMLIHKKLLHKILGAAFVILNALLTFVTTVDFLEKVLAHVL